MANAFQYKAFQYRAFQTAPTVNPNDVDTAKVTVQPESRTAYVYK